MFAIVNGNIPEVAKECLKKYSEVIEFSTEGIVDDYLSGHVDLFFCEVDKKLVCAKNTPTEYLRLLSEKRIEYSLGEDSVGKGYPSCAHYNALVTEELLIHKAAITDQKIIERANGKRIIDLAQGMTRCSCVEVAKDVFITSDKGIEKELRKNGAEVLFIDPMDIVLPGQQYGLLGGCGVKDSKLFLIGSLRNITYGDRVNKLASSHGIDIIELYDGPLFDAGSILFL